MLAELKRLSPFVPEHLPSEILLIETLGHQCPTVPQFACFDTAFHRDMPRAARLLPIPRRYEAIGVHRYGFHGLSCAYLMEELGRVAGEAAAQGRVVLAHLGNGASMTAVHRGKGVDTTMAFTPTAGLVMSRRSGDLDPGLFSYLARVEGMTGEQFHQMVTTQSGLLGLSETSSDVRDLLEQEATDIRQPRPWRSSATRPRSGSAPWLRPWAAWTPWSSPAASVKMPLSSAHASARDWVSWASNWIQPATWPMPR